MSIQPPEIRISLGSKGEEQFLYLKNSLDLAEKFDLNFIICDNYYALREIRYRLDEAEELGNLVRLIYGKHHPIRELTADLVEHEECQSPNPIFWVEVSGSDDESRAEWKYAFSVLNERRNTVIRYCPHSILFVGPSWLHELASKTAPDVWSVRSRVFFIPDPPMEEIEKFAGKLPFDIDLLQPQKDLEPPEYYLSLAKNLENSRFKEDKQAWARLMLNAAISHLSDMQPEEALNILNGILSTSDDLDDKRLLLRLHITLGATYQSTNALESATYHYKKAQSVEQESPDTESHISILQMLGAISITNEEFVKATEYIEKALSISKATNDSFNTSVCLYYLGKIARTQGRLEDAANAFSKSIEILKTINEKKLLAELVYLLGMVQLNLERYTDGLSSFIEGYLIRDQLGKTDQIDLILSHYLQHVFGKDKFREVVETNTTPEQAKRLYQALDEYEKAQKQNEDKS